MNIYKFEMKQQLKNTLIFTGVLCMVLVMFLVMLYPAFINSKEDVLPLFEKLPVEYLKAFGMDLDSFFSYLGMLSFAYVYLEVIGAIMSLTIGIAIFSREGRYKCYDFLIAKPIDRKNIYIYKASSAVSLVLMSGAIFFSFALILYVINGAGDFSKYVVIIATSILTNILFLSVGVLLGVIIKRIRSVSAFAVGLGIIAFMIKAIQGITSSKVLKVISPLQYFSPTYIINNGLPEFLYMLIAIFIIVVTTLISYVVFQKKEFK